MKAEITEQGIVLTMENELERICCVRFGYAVEDGKILFAGTKPVMRRRGQGERAASVVEFLAKNGPSRVGDIRRGIGASSGITWSTITGLVRSGRVKKHKPATGGTYLFSLANKDEQPEA